MSVKELHARIGQVQIGGPGIVLKAMLGSCVGIAILWREKQKFGLAHCLLPNCDEKEACVDDTRFVDIAMPRMLKLLEVLPADYHELEAIVVGCGNMTFAKDARQEELVGYRNAEAARQYLLRKKIKVIHEDVGGVEGRSITLFCDTGEFKIERIPRIELE